MPDFTLVEKRCQFRRLVLASRCESGSESCRASRKHFSARSRFAAAELAGLRCSPTVQASGISSTFHSPAKRERFRSALVASRRR